MRLRHVYPQQCKRHGIHHLKKVSVFDKNFIIDITVDNKVDSRLRPKIVDIPAQRLKILMAAKDVFSIKVSREPV